MAPKPTDTTSKPILEVNGLRKCYGKRPVVENVALHVEPGEIVGLLGPNGAGKTTTFYMVAGLVPPDAGKVELNGKDVSRYAIHRRARLGLGYLPQEESIFRKLTVEQNLLAVLEAQKGLSKKERKNKADNLMERFGITNIRKSLAITLSGGEKRRLTIARALCTDPTILLLDEPFSGVDPRAVADIQKIITQLREEDGLALLITDHNVRETLHITDRTYLLVDGRVILEGSAEKIANDPEARKFYLGDEFKL
ncbi:LPS export ABC transporter ATP-binding protein [Roseibacillus persicicus]|uniref:ABC transporter ATP-binding protein n=1 Tax=Roseibacillus persicicus TaxID=454148 RepID=A0A918TDN8_9BACT|nr:LPS export ABC transporter ATP-binding protein [Roseibacillus persicicus]MDQ8190698.1 LPS export ABC transporter ATP-binding protein [Roseibacillus persicicus]GHC40850.1 ABC transporter ATP-binding protein [Roseibacillus persicicus]